MIALNRKLLRDISRLWGQVVTIALVVACGIASYITLRSTWTSLADSKNTYFAEYRFADVFAQCKRAPNPILEQIVHIPGVARTYGRIVSMATVPMPNLTETARAYLVSLPKEGRPPLNDLYLRSGRFPSHTHGDEAVVVESFAKAHKLSLGDRIPVVINGRLRHVQMVGIGLSPEYVFLGGVGDFVPDDKQVAAIWMNHEVLAPAFGLDGAFNDVSIAMEPGADQAAVMRRVDQILDPYGGLGAISRDRQVSNFLLNGELAQLENMATVVPGIFLAVAAFLLNIVLGRLIFLQRTQIAALKALGYQNGAIVRHYLLLAGLIVSLGAFLGLVLGAILGQSLTELYAVYFRFPTLVFRVPLQVATQAILFTAAAAAAGAVFSLRQITNLTPAEAMRPPAPARYHRGLLESLHFDRIFGVAPMMVLRELRRRPLRLLLSCLGIAAAVGIMVVGRFGTDSMERLIDDVFHKEQRGDVSVIFLEPQPLGIEHELEMLPGVLDAEGLRFVPVRLTSGPNWRDSAIQGIPKNPRLRGIVDRNGISKSLPPSGLLVSKKLAEILDVQPGSIVDVAVKEGKRANIQLPVSALIDDAFGLQAYMDLSELHRRMSQEPSVSMVQLRVDETSLDDLRKRLKDMPVVGQTTVQRAIIDRFRSQSAQSMRVMTLLLSAFGATIAVGVIYNNARIALSMRARDLASLRVLGFTQREISSILLGELGVQIIIGIPAGLVLGRYWCSAIMSSVDPETYRFATHVSSQTYAYAVSVALAATVLSAALVRRKLHRQDLIDVLKTRQ